MLERCHRGRSVLALLLLSLLAGCSCTRALVAQARSRDRFVPTEMNGDVRYADGSRDLAERLARGFVRSREIIEVAHGTTFPRAAQVFVCRASCFATFVPAADPETPAAQVGDSVFMNEDVLRQREQQLGMRPEDFLTHELTHLLLYQRAGNMAYLRVPLWFKEGLAVVVSDSVGIRSCTPEEAARSVVAGRAFDPGEAGSLLRPRTAGSYGLSASAFYREAGLFVSHLRAQDPTAFQLALKDVLNGEDFQRSFGRAYGQPIASMWPGFVDSMRTMITRPPGQPAPQ
jgi:hypothetical protein